MKKMILVLSVVLGVLMMGCPTDGGGDGNPGGGSPQQVNIRVTNVPTTFGLAENQLISIRFTVVVIGAPNASTPPVTVSTVDGIRVANFSFELPASANLPGNFTIWAHSGTTLLFEMENFQLQAGDNPDLVWPVN